MGEFQKKKENKNFPQKLFSHPMSKRHNFFRLYFKPFLAIKSWSVFLERYDTQHNDSQQHNDTQHKGFFATLSINNTQHE
jgi:hypothetical protein